MTNEQLNDIITIADGYDARMKIVREYFNRREPIPEEHKRYLATLSDEEAVKAFEARVAKKLAYGVSYGELPCGADPDCPDKHMDKYNTKETPLLGCRMCVLRAARFEIEAKMEEEGKRV